MANNGAAGRTYRSCRYVEGGVALAYDNVRACAIVFQDRGSPVLHQTHSTEASLDLDSILAAREELRERNRTGCDDACRGCIYLEERAWPERRYEFDWIGITNYIHCNIRCEYCWIVREPHGAENVDGKRPGQLYDAAAFVEQALQRGLLAPDAVIDWGGGGEPVLIPRFDEVFARLAAHGTTQWVHTNAVRLPKSVEDGSIDASRLKILCSLDCGTPQTYALIKRRDYFARVIDNLAAYKAIGAEVVLKYIVLDVNANDDDLKGFVRIANELGIATVLSDIDYLAPPPGPVVVDGLHRLHKLARAGGLHIRFDAVGSRGATAELRASLARKSPADLVAMAAARVRRKLRGRPVPARRSAA